MSRRSSSVTSATCSSSRACPARCVSPRRRATGCPSLPTTAAPPAPRPTGRWQWSLSNALRHRLRCRRREGRALPARPSEVTGRPEPSNDSNASNQSPRRGLGRGLEVLIGGASTQELAEIPVGQIHANPRQPRKRFEHEATAGLADSIRAQGIIQPLLVRPRQAGGYELIAGGRRWRAAREAGVESLPAVVREAADRDALLLGLVENVAREELSPVEEARAYAVLMDEFALSLGEVA